MYMKRFIAVLIILFGISACGQAIPHKIAKDYKNKIPVLIAVLPVVGEKAGSDVRHLFRTMTQEKLSQMNYSLLPIDAIDEKLMSANIGKKEFFAKPPAEIGRLLDADAVVYVAITDYDRDFWLAYSSLGIEARFDMYISATGERIWTAKYKQKASEFGLDKEALKVQTTKAYEPIIQRIVDAAFSTLPAHPEKKNIIKQEEDRKRYFEWLK